MEHRVVWLALAVALAGCATDAGVSASGPALTAPPVEVSDASAEAIIEGVPHRIEASAWRHVPSETTGGGLRCAELCAELRVVADGPLADVEVTEVSVVAPGGTAAFDRLDTRVDDGVLTIGAEGGPAEIGDGPIDLVVTLDAGGDPIPLRAYGVPIERG